MENNNLREKVHKNVKEKIAVSNIRKEFDMKENANNKIVYEILAACAVIALCIGMSVNLKNNNNIKISKNDNTIKTTKETHDVIVFNEGYSGRGLADIDVKFEEEDLKQEFGFINNIKMPEGMELTKQGKILVRPSQESKDYSKLRQYSLIYCNKDETNSPYLEIIFTTENTILGCMLPDENEMKTSIISGTEVKLLGGKNLQDKTKIAGESFFKKGDYKFYVGTGKINKDDFINIIKSILESDEI